VDFYFFDKRDLDAQLGELFCGIDIVYQERVNFENLAGVKRMEVDTVF